LGSAIVACRVGFEWSGEVLKGALQRERVERMYVGVGGGGGKSNDFSVEARAIAMAQPTYRF
jgi:hypothetical protein